VLFFHKKNQARDAFLNIYIYIYIYVCHDSRLLSILSAYQTLSHGYNLRKNELKTAYCIQLFQTNERIMNLFNKTFHAEVKSYFNIVHTSCLADLIQLTFYSNRVELLPFQNGMKQEVLFVIKIQFQFKIRH
jgi:hypothetical protein